MITADKMAIRRKIMGTALRKARLAQDRSVEALAQQLESAPETIVSYERGETEPTLPELEVMASYLDVPVQDLLEGQVSDRAGLPTAPQARLIRSKMIGTMLRRARQTADLEIGEVAEQAGCSVESLKQYEKGHPVPVLQLYALARALEIPFERFFWARAEEKAATPEPAETRAPDSGTGREDVEAALAGLPPEFREFLAAPKNLPYIQVAIELSRFPAQGLRAVAEALLAAQSE
jgi:transcriptional regulator with XRE-family HTH domain